MCKNFYNGCIIIVLFCSNAVADCQSISGTYSVFSEENNSSSRSTRLDRDVFAMNHSSQGRLFVNVQEDKYGHLLIFLENQQHEVLSTRTFDSPYNCEGPWKIYLSVVNGSSVGSSVLRTTTQSKVKKDRDGSLLVEITTSVVYRRWLFFSESKVFKKEHKFKSVNADVRSLLGAE